MSEPDWRRIKPTKHKWLRERAAEFKEDGDADYAKYPYERHYVPKSKGRRQWPLLVLAVLPRWRSGKEKLAGRHRVTVVGSIKRDRSGWFEEGYGIPTTLLDDVAEMFANFIAEAKKG